MGHTTSGPHLRIDHEDTTEGRKLQLTTSEGLKKQLRGQLLKPEAQFSLAQISPVQVSKVCLGPIYRGIL